MGACIKALRIRYLYLELGSPHCNCKEWQSNLQGNVQVTVNSVSSFLRYLTSVRTQEETNTRNIYWGVSDHHKAIPDLIVFWKHQCALMYHNIFMKRIGSTKIILNHSEIFLEDILIFLWLFGVISSLKTFFFRFS